MAFLPAGMRNNNPGNIKYVGQAGTRPSINTDQGDPQAVYPSAEAGMSAMYSLLRRKFEGGKVTPRMMIAGAGGWTPGNVEAAANVARTAGIGIDDNIGFNNPANASRFMRGLLLQEHGPASNAYSDEMISNAIGGGGAVTLPGSGGAQPVGVNMGRPAATYGDIGGQPDVPLSVADLFGGRVEASGLMDMPTLPGAPPMTPERFLTGMIAGENPLRAMVFHRLFSVLG